MSKLAVLAWKEGEVYVADCPAVRIASQGDTEEEALQNLREAVELHFEDALDLQEIERLKDELRIPWADVKAQREAYRQ